MPDPHRKVLRRLARLLGPPDTERLTYELLACSISECAELAGLVPHLGRDLPDRWLLVARRLPFPPDRIRETLEIWADADGAWSGWDRARSLEVQRFAAALTRSRDPFYARVGEQLQHALGDERARRRSASSAQLGLI